MSELLPPLLAKEVAVRVLEASAAEDAAGEAPATGFDPNVDIGKKCKWSLMRR